MGKLKLYQTKGKHVYQCNSIEEIQTTVKCLKGGISVRGGGHEGNGASLIGDNIIGLRIIDQKIETQGKHLTLSANIRTGNLYKRLHALSPKFNVVAGSCPTV